MSWEMAKKLEKTNIDPAVNTPSTSTLSPPGILTVTLHKGVGFSAPGHYKERSNGYEHDHHPRCRPVHFQRCNFPYALLEYEKCQVSLDCYVGTTESPVWMGHLATCKFDIFRFAELTIYLYLRDPNASRASRDMLLGVARVDPFDGLGKPEAQWLTVQDGTGKIRISLEYLNVGNRTLETADLKYLHNIGEGGSGCVTKARKEDTQRTYAGKKIRKAELICQSEATHPWRSQINHPFIAPLTIALESQEDLHLLSPFVSGGHLFHYLQKERCFDVDRSRFYAAEILCALEYLHDAHSIFSWLKPRNVFLDSVGHIVLCGFGLFVSEMKNGDRSIHGMPEYPAPELLLGQDEFRMADWWTLGVFLYEMLTGLPLFYDEDSDEISHKILIQAVQLPESLALAAKDIITKLLDRKPEQRLGANGGASEIKAHPFFAGVDWHKILQRKYELSFKPNYDVAGSFKQHGVKSALERELHIFSYNRPILPRPESNIGTDNALTLETRQATVQEDDGWELVWEEASREFHFCNRFTGARQPVPPRLVNPLEPGDAAIHESADPTVPSRSQKQDALEAALQAGHDHIVAQLLEYGMDLTSPLEWAAEHERPGLVRLFLDKGADANFPNFPSRGIHNGWPALIKALEKGNRELAEALVRKTDRVASTRALGLAVDRRDIAMVRLLLANSVRCDFEEADRPHPQHPLNNGYYFSDLSEPKEFLPPLVRVVKQGNVDLARSPLSHGADANVSYHDLTLNLLEMQPGRENIKFSCGRVIELAMESETSRNSPVVARQRRSNRPCATHLAGTGS
ncbi:Serine/threonine-protein kinase gad8 [Tolypocladium ophioglossoides CBS 100239]|uniref:non-specific serine/threonine protein kinase n=1 Tax=Tolypocladium ophioglossoides (strain CBS 100239) TaxID=1163406 RepID=A0A0L0MZB7_TOLOC|nr:Serine/threonine-protein kinase gad8 [Tolypocladium ophioglossoides CBS 100239]